MLLHPEQTRRLIAHAVENHYAVLAVQADSPAAISDVLLAAETGDAPVILEVTTSTLSGHGCGMGNPLLGVNRYLAEVEVLANSDRFRNVPVACQVNGSDGALLLKHAMQMGASSLRLDGSDLDAESHMDRVCDLCAIAIGYELSACLEIGVGRDEGLNAIEEARAVFGELETRFPDYLALWTPRCGAGITPDALGILHEMACEFAGRSIGLVLPDASGLPEEAWTDAIEAGVAKVNWGVELQRIRVHAARAFFLEQTLPDLAVAARDHGWHAQVSRQVQPVLRDHLNRIGAAGQGQAFIQSLYV